MWMKTKDIRRNGVGRNAITAQIVFENDEEAEPLSKITFIHHSHDNNFQVIVAAHNHRLFNELVLQLGGQLLAGQHESDLFLNEIYFDTIDERFLANVFNRLLIISPGLSNVINKLNVNLNDPYEEIPAWIQSSNDDRNANGCTFFRTNQGDVIKVEVEKLGSQAVEITLHARDKSAFDRLNQLIRTSGTTRDEYIHTFTIRKPLDAVNYFFVSAFLRGAALEEDLVIRVNQALRTSNAADPVSAPIHFQRITPRTANARPHPARNFDHFYCAINFTLMTDPVNVPGTTACCERSAIETWLNQSPNGLNPFTGLPGLTMNDIRPNANLQAEIELYRSEIEGNANKNGGQMFK